MSHWNPDVIDVLWNEQHMHYNRYDCYSVYHSWLAQNFNKHLHHSQDWAPKYISTYYLFHCYGYIIKLIPENIADNSFITNRKSVFLNHDVIDLAIYMDAARCKFLSPKNSAALQKLFCKPMYHFHTTRCALEKLRWLVLHLVCCDSFTSG